jgi:predicted transcriptional regulator
VTKLLDQAIFRVRALPEAAQDAAAGLLLEFVEQPTRSLLTDAQLAEARLALEEVREGKFATEEEMAEVWRNFEH